MRSSARQVASMGTSTKLRSNSVERDLHQTLMLFLISNAIVLGFNSVYRLIRMFVRVEDENICKGLLRTDDILMSLLPALNAGLYSFRSRQFRQDLESSLKKRRLTKSEETTRFSVVTSNSEN